MPATMCGTITSGPPIWPRATAAARMKWACSSGEPPSGVAADQEAASVKNSAKAMAQSRFGVRADQSARRVSAEIIASL